MGYKKDAKYILGVVIAILSVLLMAVTFVLMGFGSDPAILWFFVGSFGLVLSNFIIVSVKGKYERAFEDEPSNLEIAKENIQNFKQRLFKRGVFGAAFLGLLVVCFVVTAVVGIKTLNTAYQKSGALNAGYHYNLRQAEQYEQLRIEQLSKGNLKFATELEYSRDKCIEDSEWYLSYHNELSEQLSKQKNVLLVTASVNAVILVGYIAFVLIKKKEKQRENEV